MNAKRLVPIAGALVLGLIGVAQATCYVEHSEVCMDTWDFVDYIAPPVGCGQYGSQPVYATSTWYVFPLTESPYGGWTIDHQDTCRGQVTYWNCQIWDYDYIDNFSAPNSTYDRIDDNIPANCWP